MLQDMTTESAENRKTPMPPSTSANRGLLWAEGVALFVMLPSLLALNGFHRPTLYTSLWLSCAYVFLIFMRSTDFSWRRLWHGQGWTKERKRQAVKRFLIATMVGVALLAVLAPERLFDFPRHKPEMWLMVMVFYPLISVVPQEFIYRCFFCTRYAALFPSPTAMLAANATAFGAMHAVMQNWVAPLLSLIGGLIFAHSYRQHRSLKYAALEHAAYGCMIFTIGLGWYFFRGISG